MSLLKRKSSYDFPDLSTMTRIHEPGGSRPSIDLDQSWTDLDKLRWKARIVEIDAGVAVTPVVAQYWRNEVKQDGFYAFNSERGCGGTYRFHEAWDFLNGVDLGARLARGGSVQ
jgi:hypothetical protein